MLLLSHVSCANFVTVPAKAPTIKNGNPLPSPKNMASMNPNNGFALAAATERSNNNGAADVPKLKTNP